MIKKTLFLLMLQLSHIVAIGASKITVSGHVRDESSGEILIGAAVYLKARPDIGTVTNEYGFYSISLTGSEDTLTASFIGYHGKDIAVHGGSDLRLDIALHPATKLEEVIVKANGADATMSNAQMGIEKLNIAEIKTIPVLFGEKDVLKTLQLLPGVKSAGDGNSGFYVRGGGSDQNLILLDGATVYNPSHLFGFFSTFNSDAIKDVTMYKGAMPAQYGGRLSSVEDIRMNDGNNKGYHVSGGIGLIAARLNVEGPLGSEKGSFLLSGRRTYADAVMRLWPGNDMKQELYFYDFNLKANYAVTKRDKLFISGYFGKDVLSLENDFRLNWSNKTSTLRWNHIINSKLFSNTSLIFSDYLYDIKIRASMGDFGIRSKIQDWNLKQELSIFPSAANSYRIGLDLTQHTITPGEITNNTTGYIFKLPARTSLEGALYFAGKSKVNPRLNIDYGVRISAFAALGAGDYYELDERHQVRDTQKYSSGEIAALYIIPEPRFSASYLLTSNSSLKASYARNAQYLHLLSNTTSATPTDKWTSSNNLIKPGISDQVALGYYLNVKEGTYELSSEVYYKSMQNEVDYKDGADVYSHAAIETQLLFGKGRAYGLELLIKKKLGKLTGWIGYTLSRSERQIEGINNNDWYVTRQDRTHDLSIVGIYELNRKWTLSGTFVYSTGNAVTFPSGKYNVAGNTVLYYTERNGYRMPAYHRLDISATKQLRHNKRFSSELSFGLYNAYGRENAYLINFRANADNPEEIEAVQTTLFTMVPSISYNFKF